MNKWKFRTAILFPVIVFGILLATMFLTIFFIAFLYRVGILKTFSREMGLVIFALVSVLIGTVLSRFAGKRPIDKITEINEATKEVAKGNFNVRLDENIPVTEFQEMARSFNIMVTELSGTEMLRNDFVENVSHEFKTPLTAIEGYATLLQKPGLSEENRVEYTQKILVNTRRLNSLTGNILLLSRLENQGMEIRTERYSLDEQIRECILLLENRWSEKKIELDIDLEDLEYPANRELMVRVWMNILGNAIKFTPEGGTIRISLRSGDRGAEIQVSDTGCGMSPEEQRHMFEKFYQGDRSRSTQGNGLGLALAKRIVDLHGGTIRADSAVDAGTTITVHLPYGV